MKNDTSNIIDLDSLLQTQQEFIIETAKPIQAVDIDWDDILTEWSYRCPKGYPTTVDGVFSEYDEVEILNELLEESGLEPIQLPEASTQYSQATADTIIASPAFKNLVNIQQVVPSLPTKNKASFKLYVSDVKDAERATKSADIVKAFIKSVPAGMQQAKATTLDRERGKKNIIIQINGYVYEFILKVYKESGTDTDIKEGFSVACAYFPKDVEKLDATNVIPYAKEFKRYLLKTKISGLSKAVQKKLVDYLTKVIATNNVKLLKIYALMLNQNISHANTFGEFFAKNSDFYIERDDLFNRIRSAASKTVSMDKDKWCPGDVYFIKNGSESIIEDRLNKAAASKSKEQGIQLINSLFSDRYLSKVSDKTPIVAVSLKQAKAQGGKLKSALDQYSKAPTDFNLTPDELKYAQDKYLEGIDRYQKIMKAVIAKERETYYNWNMYDTTTFRGNTISKDQLEVTRFKYAAYKALDFILNKVAKEPSDLDTALVSLAAFGLGLVQVKEGSQYVNPPFFKVIASADGSATKPQFFKPGTLVTLLPINGLTGKPEIKINDSPKYKGLQMTFVIGVGDKKYLLEVNFRPNGMTQLTIELGPPKHIE